MNCKEFCDFLKRYHVMLDRIDRWADSFNDLFEDTTIGCMKDDLLPLDILKCVMHDEENGWIDYWIWELDWGRRWAPGTVLDHGIDAPLATSEQLYNFLIKCMEGKSE